jgi:hypothetical protein
MDTIHPDAGLGENAPRLNDCVSHWSERRRADDPLVGAGTPRSGEPHPRSSDWGATGPKSIRSATAGLRAPTMGQVPA